MKACKTCQFYDFGHCHHPEVRKFDLVYGAQPALCNYARSWGKCGNDGKYHAEKPKGFFERAFAQLMGALS